MTDKDHNKTILEVVKESGGVIMVQGKTVALKTGLNTMIFLPPDRGWEFVSVTPNYTHALWRPPREEREHSSE